jgi:hypothetical protein
MTPRTLCWGDLRVPWIAPWSDEYGARSRIIARQGPAGPCVGYADEVPHADRHTGVLWQRAGVRPGGGKPDFAGVHVLRQRKAMTRLLCQVCGTSTMGRPDGRTLFVVRSTSGEPMHEGERTTAPPIHETCARQAIQDCPHLRGTWTAALVTVTWAWGVAGIMYDRDTLKPLPGPEEDGGGLEHVAYDDSERIRWIIAARDVVSLRGIEPVDIDSVPAP